MHGNVREMCADRFGDDYYRVSPTDDPKGPDAGEWRVARGGYWASAPKETRSAARIALPPKTGMDWYGFRVVRNP